MPVFLRVSDEHIRLKCGVDALQYVSFQKHLLVFAVIIFCLSIGIVLPVNYSGTNGRDTFSTLTLTLSAPIVISVQFLFVISAHSQSEKSRE